MLLLVLSWRLLDLFSIFAAPALILAFPRSSSERFVEFAKLESFRPWRVLPVSIQQSAQVLCSHFGIFDTPEKQMIRDFLHLPLTFLALARILHPKTHCEAVIPNLLNSVENCLSVLALGIPISAFHSEIIAEIVPAPNPIAEAILSLCSPLSHLVIFPFLEDEADLLSILLIHSYCHFLYLCFRHNRRKASSNSSSISSSFSSSEICPQWGMGLHIYSKLLQQASDIVILKSR